MTWLKSGCRTQYIQCFVKTPSLPLCHIELALTRRAIIIIVKFLNNLAEVPGIAQAYSLILIHPLPLPSHPLKPQTHLSTSSLSPLPSLLWCFFLQNIDRKFSSYFERRIYKLISKRTKTYAFKSRKGKGCFIIFWSIFFFLLFWCSSVQNILLKFGKKMLICMKDRRTYINNNYVGIHTPVFI